MVYTCIFMGTMYMYWLTLLYCAGLVMMDEVPIQDFIGYHIDKYIKAPWDMTKKR